MTAVERVVVVGASIGGLTAAETLRQEGFDGEVVLIGDERHRPYNRPPLSKQILVGEWQPEDAGIRRGTEIDDLGIDLRTSCTAEALDVSGRILHTSHGEISYDELIIATGTEPRRHPILPTALMLRTMDDAVAIRDGLRSARRVVVVGPGILGSEIASAARKYGADTLLVGRSGSLTFGGVGALLSTRLARLHTENGVELALDAELVSALPESGSTTIEFADGRVEQADLVVSMIGGVPRTQWLQSSGLSLTDGVVCDESGLAADGVFAIGDVAAWRDPYTGRPVRVEHQSNAIEQAIAVALRLVHGEQGARPVPLFWSELHGTRINAFGWFDPDRPLEAFDGSADPHPTVLVTRDDAERVHGAVGWNAPPREFRVARAAVAESAASTRTLAARS
jgi:NADPH-dependent 2,4-dienoyl-CoA reductase/sulfur reductase-like enzyme